MKKSTTSLRKAAAFISLSFGILYGSTANTMAQTDSTQISIASIHTLHSNILKEDRRLYIHTPANMKKDEVYPVLYLLDGGEHIELVAGEITYLSESYKIIPEMIVVGIANTDRVRDLTPTHSITGPDGKPDTSATAMGRNSGGGEQFMRFVKEELMPYIEKSYPAAPYRILSGHSLGGLMAIYAMVYHPDYFNACIAISPSLQWDGGMMLKAIADKQDDKNGRKRVIFFSDGAEGGSFHLNQLVLDSLLKRKAVAGLRWAYQSYPAEAHLAEPVKAFYDGIRTIYPEWYLPFTNAGFRKTVKASDIKAHYTRLSAEYGYRIIPPQDEINAISRMLRNDPVRVKDSIELLEMNAANHPNATAYENLGDTYAKAGDTAKALSNYRHAQRLTPNSKALQEKIEKSTTPHK